VYLQGFGKAFVAAKGLISNGLIRVLNNWLWRASIRTEQLKLDFMKAKIVTATTLALLAVSSVRNTQAGDREWATAGKVLTGIAAASVISHALEPRPVVYAQAPTVVYQTVPTTTAVVTSQPVVTTTPVPVTATIPDAQTVPNAPTVGQQTVVVQQPQPTVVYQQQPTVVYAQPQVIYAPAPVYYPPVVYGPRIGFGVVIGGGHYHGHYGGHYRHW